MINEYIYILYLANVKMLMIKFTVKCKFKKKKNLRQTVACINKDEVSNVKISI